MQPFHLKRQEKITGDTSDENSCRRLQLSNLNLERIGLLLRCRRLLQALGKTLGAWTDFAQIFEGIYPAIMTIAPAEAESIIADGINTHALDAGRNTSGNDSPFSREFLDAFGAHAFFPQIPGRIGAYMPIIPDNIGLFGTYTLHTRR